MKTTCICRCDKLKCIWKIKCCEVYIHRWHEEDIFHVIAPLKFQITIDVSPPHEGSVHDGIRGEPEVDYQQDLHIDAYWEGFFDRESGVEYYQYVFSDHCLTNSEFINSTQVFIFVVNFLKFYIHITYLN